MNRRSPHNSNRALAAAKQAGKKKKKGSVKRQILEAGEAADRQLEAVYAMSVQPDSGMSPHFRP
jgi:hypothetical protein